LAATLEVIEAITIEALLKASMRSVMWWLAGDIVEIRSRPNCHDADARLPVADDGPERCDNDAG
jgi:hypothetical protein